MGELLKKTFRFSWIGILIIFLVLAYISFSIFSSSQIIPSQNEEMFGTLLFILIMFIMIVFSFLLSIFLTTYIFSKKQFSSRITSALIGMGASIFSFIIIYLIIIPVVFAFFNLFEKIVDDLSYFVFNGITGVIATGITGLLLGIKSTQKNKNKSKDVRKHY